MNDTETWLKFWTTLLIATLGGVVTALGWVVTYRQTKSKEENNRQRTEHLIHLKAQIEEFYGPLFGLLQYGKTVYTMAQKHLPKGDLYEGGTYIDMAKFEPQDARVWEYFVYSYLLPVSQEATALIRTKIYLLDQAKLPAGFREFLETVSIMECGFGIWKDKQIGLDFTQGQPRGWPVEFADEVENTLASLLVRYKNLSNVHVENTTNSRFPRTAN